MSSAKRTAPATSTPSESTAGPSKKRSSSAALGSAVDAPPTKISKVHPFFAKPPATAVPNPTTSSFQWLSPLGPQRTCLHGINLTPKASPKIAAFDLDGTVIKSRIGVKGVKYHPTEFHWFKPNVPAKLKQLHIAGFSLVLISNQALKDARLKDWKSKIPLIAAALPDVPFRILAATAKDDFRKPSIGMWRELEREFTKDDVVIDKDASFFVGDAAGRRGDFSDSDLKWAQAAGVPFFTPEDYFKEESP
ncbi:hypothetical protein PLICRDRAFT_593985 [Plicaturopsis crispa FD-325 SS-3]|nr:hypothetical protein PLICRDRAFT_593985 [Plicaturopsis crispa FD-325 SS-3]